MLYLPNFATVFFSVCVCVCGTNHDFTLSDYLHKAVKHTSDFTSHTPCRLCGFILSLYVLKKKPNKTPPNNNKKTTNKKTQNKNQKNHIPPCCKNKLLVLVFPSLWVLKGVVVVEGRMFQDNCQDKIFPVLPFSLFCYTELKLVTQSSGIKWKETSSQRMELQCISCSEMLSGVLIPFWLSPAVS